MDTVVTESWIREIPKIELHVHLEGSIRPALLRRLAGENKVPLPAPAAGDHSEPAYHFADFPQFLECFRVACSVIRSPQDLATAAAELLAELARQRVLAAEIFLSPVIHERSGIDTVEVMRQIDAVAREARKSHGLHSRFLFDSVRQWGVDTCQQNLQLALRCRKYGVIGIGIGGDEGVIAAEAFAPLFRQAREAGLRLTVHAGETTNPDNVRQALRHLRPERIGHGLQAARAPELLKELRQQGITLDMSLTSNRRTGAWPDLATHPVCEAHAAGARVTLNTDDPALFATTLGDEYRIGAQLLGLTRAGLEALVRGALDASFLEQADRAEVARGLDAGFAAAAAPGAPPGDEPR